MDEPRRNFYPPSSVNSSDRSISTLLRALRFLITVVISRVGRQARLLLGGGSQLRGSLDRRWTRGHLSELGDQRGRGEARDAVIFRIVVDECFLVVPRG